MKLRIQLLIFSLVSFLYSFAQTPQNIDRGKGRGESMWDSTTTIILIAAFIILMIVSRTWAKKVRNKRDERSEKDNSEKSSEKDKESK